ncbi:hypothetical protein ACFCX4_35240 [Kitasatospora sp. NPDC056327]|uniref:hypothetical protein n=1 Tax=Kitasatospora sp. NPDC056327 TaxID=3345785 RepID=UPI0035E0DFBA
MSSVAEYELKLDWVRIDDVSESSDDPVGEVYGKILLDDTTLWYPSYENAFGNTRSDHASMKAGEFFKLPADRSTRRHFDEDALNQSTAFRLQIRLKEKDDWNSDDEIATVDEEIRPDLNELDGKSSLTREKTASADGRITYRYTLTRLG